ncbi:sensor histidine kinase [Thermaerobacillus caldiproteolyticus]|uniref:sensor histidine kinase n=1 Tax=Thermaerobacillus caldiproteolyticus TaxID=247480 RepID=UPI00188BAAD6|nr:sensor histidine kinase [Anoxybacillus caldiproteolyticus]QPA31148.1 sensor histidine kinase [Anoxybacillus caldiproteolyticus]
MELWLILSRFIVWGYIAVRYVYSDNTTISWFVLSSLLYLCINITIYIVKKDAARRLTILLSIVFILISNFYIYPLFILLLPINLYELASYYIHKKWMLFLLLLIPILFIEEDVYLIYGLVMAFSFINFTIAKQYTLKITQFENNLDKMRKDIQRLTKSLNEQHEYIKQSEYTFKLEERNRLSQEIHDKIGHSMTGALIQMEASKRLMEIDKEKAKELLQNAINISKEGIENIRMTLKQIKPPSEQIGINRVRLFIEEFSAKHHIQIPFVCKGNLDVISPIQWKIIYENITEALTNAMKYAEATVVSIEIHVLNTLIKVEVKDNGKGVEKIKKGLGIIGMEERAASVNGTVIVDGTNGFSVTTLLPIQG